MVTSCSGAIDDVLARVHGVLQVETASIMSVHRAHGLLRVRRVSARSADIKLLIRQRLSLIPTWRVIHPTQFFNRKIEHKLCRISKQSGTAQGQSDSVSVRSHHSLGAGNSAGRPTPAQTAKAIPFALAVTETVPLRIAAAWSPDSAVG